MKRTATVITLIGVLIGWAAIAIGGSAQDYPTTSQVKLIHFDMSDTTLEFKEQITIDPGGINEEVLITSKRFDLKKAADRDSLRNNINVEPLLSRMGTFLSNQFP